MNNPRKRQETQKNALRDAGLTPEEFAQVIQVDPKSVTRWLTGAANPYPRHRAKSARALDRTEQELWPEVIAPDNHQPVVGDVVVNEVTGSWGYADQETIPDLVALITASTGPIDLLNTGHGLEVNLPVVSGLLEQADQGDRCG